ncbi:aspartyl-phosphate phosphatase Spo0E family protein [Tepidibacter thalassicus]|uniref:Spo0E like sporulation regulatory protein n=1 Tax=Tepidibacter thalassicus DSM 15285 TaxID=1123350 RepID=A0A1M5PKT8_9FIRM|nr:aspartyl-phosphate phosphatase Spo0E family protein [Tepidibacter thalassicus]SHH02382.1 Spo0E like sporulation regulatory protein [Tepidibacter thalassicus DSM 15285]
MKNDSLVMLKENIEDLREEINRYIEYPDIFKEEILLTSRRIDELINEYLKLQRF